MIYNRILTMFLLFSLVALIVLCVAMKTNSDTGGLEMEQQKYQHRKKRSGNGGGDAPSLSTEEEEREQTAREVAAIDAAMKNARKQTALFESAQRRKIVGGMKVVAGDNSWSGRAISQRLGKKLAAKREKEAAEASASKKGDS